MIVIDSDEYYMHGIECMKFPGGEPHVKVPKFKGNPLLHLKLRDWDSVGFAALLQDALRRQGHDPISFIPYFPGARQDRSDGTAAVTVEVMARLLCHGGRVVTFDPHSRATTHAYPAIRYMMPVDLHYMRTQPDVVGIIAPDIGALTRARLFHNRFYFGTQSLISCTKTRDAQTGKLSNYVMPALQRPGRYIVVDDICDGGGTFNLLAEAFKKDPMAKDSKLELFVSHGIFSKGLAAIDPIYEHITTTDSWCSMHTDGRLTVIPLLPALLPNLEKYL